MEKILFMVSSLNIGGVEKSLISLLHTMPKASYDITVLVLEKKGGFLDFLPSYVKVEEVTFYPSIKLLLMGSPYEILDFYKKQHAFIKRILFIGVYLSTKYLNNRWIYLKYILKQLPSYRETFDIAISYCSPTELIDSYILYKVKARKKVSWIHFDIDKVKPNFKLYSKIYSKYSSVVTVSDEARDKMKTYFPNLKLNPIVVKNIVCKELIQREANEEVDFDNDYKGIKIVTVGRLAYEKGQDIAIRVLKRLKEDGENIRWYCIGEGKQRKVYEQMIKENNLEKDFILLGALTNPYPYMKQADLYIQPSRHEGFCLSIAEAKCLNKVIIATRFTGATEQIKQGETGFIIDFKEESLYEKIKYLLTHKRIIQRVENHLIGENSAT